jgi:hypothetical protein
MKTIWAAVMMKRCSHQLCRPTNHKQMTTQYNDSQWNFPPHHTDPEVVLLGKTDEDRFNLEQNEKLIELSSMMDNVRVWQDKEMQ